MLLAGYGKFVDICVGYSRHYSCSLRLFSLCVANTLGKEVVIFVLVVLGIMDATPTRSSIEPKLGRAMCQKGHCPALGVPLMPSTLFWGSAEAGLGDAPKCVYLHSTNNFSL